jgi:glycogen debranching enzyme
MAGVSFPDGTRALPPLALIEVQAYAADAYTRAARLFSALGRTMIAQRCVERARAMKELVESEFWLEKEGRYAFAIDHRGRRVDTITSNVGHLLWTRIPSPERAKATAELLLSHHSFSGFGVRTVASGQPVFNPLSYHNGSVWPHDNALIARGLAKCGFADHALTIFDGLLAALEYFSDDRLPELFCGLDRAQEGLVHYPVACRPQAWAAAAPFLLMTASLGLSFDAPKGRMFIHSPRLPARFEWVRVSNLRVGSSRVSILFRNEDGVCRVEDVKVSGGAIEIGIG